MGHAVRVVDGIGAYDHVSRASMLSKLLEVPRLRKLLPFVRKTHATPSCYKWADAEGHTHEIWQHEGSEQGDPLMPLLFSLAIHNALAEVRGQMQDGEFLFAFLDDVYVIASPARTRTIYNLVQDRLHTMAGTQLHQGKTRVWNREGTCPAELEDLGEEVWSPRGVKILGTPIGSQRIRPISGSGEVARGAAIVGSRQLGARSAMCMADPVAVCRAPLPPLCAHPPTQRVPVLRGRPR